MYVKNWTNDTSTNINLPFTRQRCVKGRGKEREGKGRILIIVPDWRLGLPDTSQPFSIYRQVFEVTCARFIHLINRLFQILRLFTDSPLISSPYSVHNIVMRNKAMVRLNNPDSGETSTTNPFKAEPWFAPSAICRVLKYAFKLTVAPPRITNFSG